MTTGTTSRRARFNAVEVREYPLVLSENPACEYGPSVELGWEYEYTTNSNTRTTSSSSNSDRYLTVSQYEQERQGKRRTTAAKPSKLYLSQVKREAALKKANYTDDDLKRAVRRKSEARRQRSLSNALMNPMSKIQASFAASRRNKKLKRAVRNLKKQKGKEPAALEHSEIYSGWWLPFSGDLF
eukprot:CAMPEP_0178505280 /NCGR_PEP_ID=MMETSP0696-20121128/19047_1 /TAXON_ID=265572 /ORGANISM="Extubocellulus spinifer, Strain CCMP396" /LENGTH=183 /DNA_ID=CAMNT_0020134581 /DNA_START=24 /DNA_END=575 /DNA_ORIENTATION=+